MNGEKKTYIAYRCPECGNAIDFFINIFQLSGKGFEMSCPECKSSKINITRASDGKIRLLVPCLVCPHPHPYTLSDEIFFNRDLFALQCSFTGMDICFIGDEINVIESMSDNEKLLEEMMYEEEEETDPNAAEMHKVTSRKTNFENSFIMYEVLNILKDLIEAGDISCNCAVSNKENLSVSISDKDVTVLCKSCGKKLIIPAVTERDLNNVIDMEILSLD